MREHTHVLVIIQLSIHQTFDLTGIVNYIHHGACGMYVCLFTLMCSGENVYHKLWEAIINTGKQEGSSTLVGFNLSQSLKAVSHIACRAHAAPMPFPNHAILISV